MLINSFNVQSLEACIIICNNHKSEDKKGKVLFIDARNEVSRRDNISFLEPEHIDKIAKVYEKYTDVDKFAKVVSIDAIKANNNLLSIISYVDCNESEKEIIEVPAALNQWSESSKSLSTELETLSNK